MVYSGKYARLMILIKMMKRIEKLRRILNVKINMTIDIKENINDHINNTTTDNASITITDKEFPNKRELYNHYGINITTIPDGYEVKMRYINTQGKMGGLCKLVNK